MKGIWTVLHSLRIQDFFDIVLIAVMISAVMIWFKDRASRFVFLGISLVGLIYILARFFQLYLTTVVLQGFFAILLFVLVVIFQEDLRRFFERLALWGRFRRAFTETTVPRESAEILTQTAANLAHRKVGALMVLKGEDPLDRHLVGGIRLDGLLSQPLLESIFDPSSMGHDGAVIIDGNRVMQFGCHLPLSVSAGRYGNVGLRHTAALGMAERTDALCIVVSEEKGTVSVAQGETLEPLSGPAVLGGLLESFYAKKSPAQKSRPLTRWLKENPREKVIAIVLACILWFIFGYQRDSIQRDYVVPIEYINLPRSWSLEKPAVTEARVMLMGPLQAFQLLNDSDLKLSLDLSQIRSGRQEMPLQRDMVVAPSNLSVVNIKPTHVILTATRLAPVWIPVEVMTENAPEEGFVVQKTIAIPALIRALVPDKTVQTKRHIRTESIDLQHLRHTTTVDARLQVPPDVSFADGKAPTVKVVITVKRKR